MSATPQAILDLVERFDRNIATYPQLTETKTPTAKEPLRLVDMRMNLETERKD